ncbi:unnamed protein product [Anisakis simplex]|uniref:Protein kinase domain-containing protein n=1 Tax=Anisakis simplex TaxID=6269 RepID=A0A0M3KI59_ANISI|nr:unnamed protein product [Anisakis simplex]
MLTREVCLFTIRRGGIILDMIASSDCALVCLLQIPYDGLAEYCIVREVTKNGGTLFVYKLLEDRRTRTIRHSSGINLSAFLPFQTGLIQVGQFRACTRRALAVSPSSSSRADRRNFPSHDNETTS